MCKLYIINIALGMHTDSPSSIYEQLFIFLPLHCYVLYKDLYGENNDCFCNL